MRRQLGTKRGPKRYALLMHTVEPVFGQIKQGRGFRRFLLRGFGEGEPGMAAYLRRMDIPNEFPPGSHSSDGLLG